MAIDWPTRGGGGGGGCVGEIERKTHDEADYISSCFIKTFVPLLTETM